MAGKKYESSSGYFNKSMQAILKKGEEKAPSKKPVKSTAKKK